MTTRNFYEIVQKLGVPAENVWIMPQGSTNEAMDAAAQWLKGNGLSRLVFGTVIGCRYAGTAIAAERKIRN